MIFWLWKIQKMLMQVKDDLKSTLWLDVYYFVGEFLVVVCGFVVRKDPVVVLCCFNYRRFVHIIGGEWHSGTLWIAMFIVFFQLCVE